MEDFIFSPDLSCDAVNSCYSLQKYTWGTQPQAQLEIPTSIGLLYISLSCSSKCIENLTKTFLYKWLLTIDPIEKKHKSEIRAITVRLTNKLELLLPIENYLFQRPLSQAFTHIFWSCWRTFQPTKRLERLFFEETNIRRKHKRYTKRILGYGLGKTHYNLQHFLEFTHFFRIGFVNRGMCFFNTFLLFFLLWME